MHFIQFIKNHFALKTIPLNKDTRQDFKGAQMVFSFPIGVDGPAFDCLCTLLSLLYYVFWSFYTGLYICFLFDSTFWDMWFMILRPFHLVSCLNETSRRRAKFDDSLQTARVNGKYHTLQPDFTDTPFDIRLDDMPVF